MSAAAQATARSQLAGLSAAVFLGTLAIGVPLPVLPQYVHGSLGYGTIVVGAVVGMQSAVTLLTRTYAGTISDTRGPKRAVLLGLVAYFLAGWGYLVAAVSHGPAALVALLCGRAVLGLGESLLITGAMAMGVARVGGARAGMAMVWVGIAMFGAYGLGAPLGDAAFHALGFAPIAGAVIVLPLLGLAFAVREASPAALPKRPARLGDVLRWVLPAGTGLALSAVGYSAIAAFLPLMLLARGWGGSGLVMTAFAVGFILARLGFGSFPDRYGGRRVALASLAVECLGQILLWQAPSVTVVALGAAFTGAGYSLAFPSLGIEAVRQVPPENRGMALGTYVAFLDVALGLGGPSLGALVDWAGFGAAYAAGAAACLLGLVITYRLPVSRGDGMIDALHEVAAGCRALFREGHADLTLGDLSLRDPEGRGAWIKRSGIGLGEVRGPSDFVLITWNGTVLAGDGARHKEWPIHTAILQARPDVMVAGHSHPFHATAFSALDVPLACVTNEATNLGSPPGLFDATTDLVDTVALGRLLAEALGNASTVLMRNHGVSFVGADVAEAVLMGVFLERACRSHLALMATGQPYRASPAAELAAKRANTLDAGLRQNFWRFLQRGDSEPQSTL